MPIPIPVTRTKITTGPWGIPITNEVNRLTTQSDSNKSRLDAIDPYTVDSGWVDCTMQNGWLAYDSPRRPRYRKIGKQVHCVGVAKSGTMQMPAFTLPAGYRPVCDMNFSAVSSTTGAGSGEGGYLLGVYSDGRVVPLSGGAHWFYFDSVSFFIA